MDTLTTIIVGAGLGGLACAIACRRCHPPIDVTIVERSAELLPVGAGIQLPPNATRILKHLGLLEKLKNEGQAMVVEAHTLRRYDTGRIIAEKPCGSSLNEKYGAEWLVIHRADYQNLLLREAVRLGAKLIMNTEAVAAKECITRGPVLVLSNGTELEGDVIVGADGLWSKMRDHIIGTESPPSETGDLAYRGTFSRTLLESLGDEQVKELLNANNVQVWMGPQKHVVFYPLRAKAEYNLVLLKPDDLPKGIRTSQGSLDEMKAVFEHWDPVLKKMISCLDTALKWKLCHHDELETWHKGSVTLLGDASHPTLPYQAQGAAMAIEDGAVIGLLLGDLQSAGLPFQSEARRRTIGLVLALYERLRKTRTAVNVLGAVQSQEFYHLPDGVLQKERDELISRLGYRNWEACCKWNWGDAEYQKDLLGFDVLRDANEQFHEWRKGVAD